MSGSHDRHLGKKSRVFEVTVGDAAEGICLGHETRLHVFGERVSPEVALAVGIVVDPSHA
jgi:hypothetical protein